MFIHQLSVHTYYYISQEGSHTEILLLLVLLADLLNGILIEIGKLHVEEQATCEEQRNMWVWVGFLLPLIILFFGVISILNDYITCTCNCSKTNPCKRIKCKYPCTYTYPCICLCPPGFQWNKTVIKLSTLTGATLYYVGDNYFEKVDCNKNAPYHITNSDSGWTTALSSSSSCIKKAKKILRESRKQTSELPLVFTQQ